MTTRSDRPTGAGREPTSKAGRELLNDVREVVVHGTTDRIPGSGYGFAWHVQRGIAAIEDEVAALRASPSDPEPPGEAGVIDVRPGAPFLGRCGCPCPCHRDEALPEWPGSCAACCDPELGRYVCRCLPAIVDALRASPSDPEPARPDADIIVCAACGAPNVLTAEQIEALQEATP